MKNKKVLSVFSLVMINVIAVDSIRTLPISALYGPPLIFFYIIGAIGFMIPIALIAAECSTGWPEEGGIYIWVKEAFGPSWGLFVAWIQWIYNIIWYPSILSLLAMVVFYIIDPSLTHNKILLLITINILFWIATFFNCFGMRFASGLSTVTAIIGTLLPIATFILMGLIWLAHGHPIAITFNAKTIIPNITTSHNLGLLTGLIFGLIGLEMSAIHASDVKQPQRDYPRALLISAFIILVSMILGSLAIAIVIPDHQLNLASGIIEAFQLYFQVYNLPWLTPLAAICIVIGGIGGVSAWLLGPGRCMMIASREGIAPRCFMKKNKYNSPINVLLLQGLIFTIFSSFYLFFPNFNSAYWLLTAITAQLALLVYMVVFLAAVQLRFRAPHQPRKFRVPGGKPGMVITSSIGFLTCLSVFILGFIPPEKLLIKPVGLYETLLITSIIIFLLLPVIFNNKKPNSK